LDRERLVFAKRLASIRWSFSLTSRSMIVARSPFGTSRPSSALRRSSLSRKAELAVNWIL
jgi:hypothetical protein